MTHVTFEPQLSDRETARVAGQKWTGCDGKEWDGAALAKRLWSLGVIEHVEQMIETPVGRCIKTGVSGYTRVA